MLWDYPDCFVAPQLQDRHACGQNDGIGGAKHHEARFSPRGRGAGHGAY